MKTPNEWLEEMKLRPCVTENDLLVIIKRIQEEAFEAGREVVLKAWCERQD